LRANIFISEDFDMRYICCLIQIFSRIEAKPGGGRSQN
jgi:hypothetical protein